MPQMADIVVKKNDGTTNVTYTAIVPSAGDKSSARWNNQSVGVAAAHRPELKLMSRDNGVSSARRLEGTFSYPSLATDSFGKVNVVDKLVMNVSVVVPKGMPDADVNEGVAQGFNLYASTLIKGSHQTGYAPT